MRYSGSKHGCQSIVRVIQHLLEPNDWYVEPFVGAGKVIESVRHGRRIGCDSDPHIITLLKAVQRGWNPPGWSNELMWEKWKERAAIGVDDPHIGFYGYGCSFGGMFFQTYIRPEVNHRVDPASETRSSLLKQKPKLEGVQLRCEDYRAYQWLSGCTIYCDPPYARTYNVGNASEKFDSKAFWKWAMKQSKSTTVLVSEYVCPLPEAKVVWQRTKQNAQGNNHKVKKPRKTELLFVMNPETTARIGLGLEL